MPKDNISIPHSNKIAIKVKCPVEMPESANCFFSGGTGNCEKCLYPVFREKINEDNRRRDELVANLKEEYRRQRGGGS